MAATSGCIQSGGQGRTRDAESLRRHRSLMVLHDFSADLTNLTSSCEMVSEILQCLLSPVWGRTAKICRMPSETSTGGLC
jgi:hypothetical protein